MGLMSARALIFCVHFFLQDISICDEGLDGGRFSLPLYIQHPSYSAEAALLAV